MFRKKKFSTSQNLKEPIELIGHEASLFMKREASNLNFINEYIGENEYMGRIRYKNYILKNLPLNFIPPKKETPFDKMILRLKMVGLIPPNYEQ